VHAKNSTFACVRSVKLETIHRGRIESNTCESLCKERYGKDDTLYGCVHRRVLAAVQRGVSAAGKDNVGIGLRPRSYRKKRIVGIIIHIREQVNSSEEFREVRKVPETQTDRDNRLTTSKSLLKIQYKLAYL